MEFHLRDWYEVSDERRLTNPRFLEQAEQTDKMWKDTLDAKIIKALETKVTTDEDITAVKECVKVLDEIKETLRSKIRGIESSSMDPKS